MTPERETHLHHVYESLRDLTDGQIGWIETVVEQFHKPASFQSSPDSDLINACVLQDLGDALRIHHLESYDRILSLRRLQRTRAYTWQYELVEIPKSLLLGASNGTLRVMHTSRQFPKSAYYDVTDSSGTSKFQLYFDAGGARKLQIKGMNQAYCIVHAEWCFETSLSESDSLLT